MPLLTECLLKRWSKTETTTSKSLINKGNVECFPWLYWCCAAWIPTNCPHSIKVITWVFYPVNVKEFGENGLKWGKKTHRFCTTASSPSAIITRELLTKHLTNTASQSLCSPDVAPCYFLLFPQLKLHFPDQRFESII